MPWSGQRKKPSFHSGCSIRLARISAVWLINERGKEGTTDERERDGIFYSGRQLRNKEWCVSPEPTDLHSRVFCERVLEIDILVGGWVDYIEYHILWQISVIVSVLSATFLMNRESKEQRMKGREMAYFTSADNYKTKSDAFPRNQLTYISGFCVKEWARRSPLYLKASRRRQHPSSHKYWLYWLDRRPP